MSVENKRYLTSLLIQANIHLESITKRKMDIKAMNINDETPVAHSLRDDAGVQTVLHQGQYNNSDTEDDFANRG